MTVMRDVMQRNHGAYSGVPVSVPSLLSRDPDTDLRFSGGSSFTIPHSADLNLLNGAVGGIAVEFPLLIPAYPLAEAFLFNKDGEYGASILPDGTLRFYLDGGAQVDSSAPIPLNQKVHVNLVYNGDYAGTPRFGKETASAFTEVQPDNIAGASSGLANLQVCPHSILEKGTVTQLVAWLERSSDHPYSEWMALVLYGDSGGLPGDLLAQSDPILINDAYAVASWVAFPISAALFPGQYWLGFVGGAALTGASERPVALIGCDTSGGTRKLRNSGVSDGSYNLTGEAASPFGAPTGSDGANLTLYADYTATGRTGEEGHALIYLDGLEDARAVYTAGITAGTNDLTGPEFDVEMGDLSLWNRKHTKVEVARHFAAR